MNEPIPVGETFLPEFEQFIVHITEEDQTIILHESADLPDIVRVDA